MSVEKTAEIQRVVKAYVVGYLGYGIVGIYEQCLGVGYTKHEDILKRRELGYMLEIPDKPGHAHVPCFCVFFNIYLG